MKRYWVIVLILLAALVVSGCGRKAEQIAGKTTTPYQGSQIFLPHPEAEAMMNEVFTALDWELDAWAEVVGSRRGIGYMFEFMEAQLDIDGNIKYYNLRVGFDFISWLWKTKLQPQLNQRSINGDMEPADSMNFYYISRDIKNNLKAVAAQLQSTERQIEDNAKQADIDMLIGVYDTIKPLIDFIK